MVLIDSSGKVVYLSAGFDEPGLRAAIALLGPEFAAPARPAQPDAAALLQEVKEKYAKTKYYNIEATQELEWQSELSRQWSKEILSAVTISGNRYRFDGRGSSGWMTKISDGERERVLDHLFNVYTEKAATHAGPSKVAGPIFVNQTVLLGAQGILSDLSGILADFLDSVLLENQTLTFGGKQVPCYVISGHGRLRGQTQNRQVMIWIDQKTNAVRKKVDHMEGALRTKLPYEHTVREATTVYTVVDLDVTSAPDAAFTFQPPAEAQLVEQFADPLKMPNAYLVGKMAPNVSLPSADGTELSLKQFRGKPVLLNFWATWWPPCLYSLPNLEKLFQEVSTKGLMLISIDEDEDAKTATNLWTRRGEAWPNFHDAFGQIQRQFPPGRMPQIILIDAAGKITYANHEFDEAGLRKAIAQLGPEFAASGAKPAP
jgi:peroxiredoxin